MVIQQSFKTYQGQRVRIRNNSASQNYVLDKDAPEGARLILSYKPRGSTKFVDLHYERIDPGVPGSVYSPDNDDTKSVFGPLELVSENRSGRMPYIVWYQESSSSIKEVVGKGNIIVIPMDAATREGLVTSPIIIDDMEGVGQEAGLIEW